MAKHLMDRRGRAAGPCGLIPSRRASRIDAAPDAPTAAVLTNSCYLSGVRCKKLQRTSPRP
jgi:hypothetical protein